MYIDSHCHLDCVDLTPYGGKIDAMLEAAREQGISQILSIATDLKQSVEMRELLRDQKNIYFSTGVHPLNLEGQCPTVEDILNTAKDENVIALGETGLDYFYQTDNLALQQQSFINHIIASKESRLPLIVHTRDAREDTLAIIKEHSDPEVAGVLHCFTESLEMAKAAIEMNYMISFSGILTFKSADELRAVAKNLPLERILIETDAPYLAPVPFRGKKNESKYLPEVARCLAALKDCSEEEIAEKTTENFFRTFPQAKNLQS